MNVLKNITDFLDNFFESMEKKEEARKKHIPIIYNILGYNGFNFDYNFIEQRFADFRRCWNVSVLENVGFLGEAFDVACYRFRVYEPKNKEASINRLEGIAREISEAVFIKFLRESGDYRNCVERLVAVQLSANALNVFFALTPCGLEMVENANRRKFE